MKFQESPEKSCWIEYEKLNRAKKKHKDKPKGGRIGRRAARRAKTARQANGF